MLSVAKLKTLIQRRAARVSSVFEMFPQEGRVVIGLSGGADSMVLTDMMHQLSRRWRRDIEFIPVLIDQGFFTLTDEESVRLQNFCKDRGMELKIVKRREIGELVMSDRNPFPPCFTCSRYRRKALFEISKELGANVIALGHHKDDLIETFLLNIFFSRRISAIMPKQEFFGGLFHIVRPLILVDESYIKRYASMRAFPVVKKGCPFVSDTRRKWLKNLIARMEMSQPGVKSNIVRSLFYPYTEYLWGDYREFADKLLK